MIAKDFAKAQKLPKDYGALVLRGQTVADFAVLPGSPADKAGIVENDIILEANGTRIEDKTTLSSVLKNLNAGDEVTLKVYHKGDEKILKIKLEDSK
jgi:S1-C subfamily serine protease